MSLRSRHKAAGRTGVPPDPGRVPDPPHTPIRASSTTIEPTKEASSSNEVTAHAVRPSNAVKGTLATIKIPPAVKMSGRHKSQPDISDRRVATAVNDKGALPDHILPSLGSDLTLSTQKAPQLRRPWSAQAWSLKSRLQVKIGSNTSLLHKKTRRIRSPAPGLVVSFASLFPCFVNPIANIRRSQVWPNNHYPTEPSFRLHPST